MKRAKWIFLPWRANKILEIRGKHFVGGNCESGADPAVAEQGRQPLQTTMGPLVVDLLQPGPEPRIEIVQIAEPACVKNYCAQDGIAVATLHYWRTRFADAVEPPPMVHGTERFLPVTLAPVTLAPVTLAPVAPHATRRPAVVVILAPVQSFPKLSTSRDGIIELKN